MSTKSAQSLEYELANQQVTALPDGTAVAVNPAPANASANCSIQQNLILGTAGADILNGTPGDDDIRALEGDDLIFGSAGNDILDGGEGFDTFDFRFLQTGVTLTPPGLESSLGFTQFRNGEALLAPPGQTNILDGSTAPPGISMEVDLSLPRETAGFGPRLTINTPTRSFATFIENFFNAIGTPGNDTLRGNADAGRGGLQPLTFNGLGGDDSLQGGAGADTLTGGAGNDIILGGDGNDIILGTATGAGLAGAGERDSLTGGLGAGMPGGQDRFILGEGTIPFYADSLEDLQQTQGRTSFATIMDFSAGDQIQLASGVRYVTSFIADSTLIVNRVVENDLVDLIAEVRFGSGVGSMMAQSTASLELNQMLDSPLVSPSTDLPMSSFELLPGQTLGPFVAS